MKAVVVLTSLPPPKARLTLGKRTAVATCVMSMGS
jgi:hypothetical protein